jgi:hypothetical protein
MRIAAHGLEPKPWCHSPKDEASPSNNTFPKDEASPSNNTKDEASPSNNTFPKDEASPSNNTFEILDIWN